MPQKTIILVVEADDAERAKLVNTLEHERFNVIIAKCAEEMRQQLARHPVDIVMLSLTLPDANGFTLIPEIKQDPALKVVVVSPKKSITDKVVAYQLGADDYIVRPFNTQELIAHVHARMRRHKQIKSYLEEINTLRENKKTDPSKIRFGNWVLDRGQWQAFDEAGRSANLTPREFHILETLVLEGNRVLTRTQLLDKAWQDGNNTTDRAVDIQILRIRRKIGDSADAEAIIRAVRGVGYQLVPVPELLK